MKRLLAVPISTTQGVVGNLYLADRIDNAPFSESDEASLRRFSALAAIAIENAVLHDQVEVLAITAERERIAREMHDSLSQVLAYVNTKSQAALAYLARDDSAAARAQIEQLAATAREAYVDVREGIFALRSAGSRRPDDSIVESMRDYIERWQEQHQVRVEFRADPPGTLGEIAPLAEIHLLRLIQEALSNIRKHADATTVSVSIERTGVEWLIMVRDNGSGFDPAVLAPGTFPRFGLSTMRERAEASGGTFHLVSVPGTGTTIAVTLPIVQS